MDVSLFQQKNQTQMTTEIHSQIRKMMKEEGVWNNAINTRVYTTEEFISEIAMSEQLKKMLRENVSRLQAYFDDRILEPINN